MVDRLSKRIRDLNVPRVEEYFGLWAVMDDRFRALVDHANQLDLAAHVAQRRADYADGDGPGMAYLVDGSVAIIDLQGPLTKYGSSLASGTSMTLARRLVRLAARDDAVSAIVLRIDSPGGTVSGTDDLGQDVAAAAEQKPVVAYIEDTGASGAYWIASQAQKIYANRSAMIGSIGVYASLVDSSAQAEQEGLKVHVLRTGEFKGDAVPGAPISDATLADRQKLVDATHDRFVRVVSLGRKLTLARTRELADGRVYLAPEAKELGLIDEIRAFDDVVAALNAKKPKRNRTSSGARAMADDAQITTTDAASAAPRAATLPELRADLPGADAAFLLSQLEASATLPQASRAWIAELSARNQAAAEKAAAAEARAAELEAKSQPPRIGGPKPGVEALPTNASDGQSAGDAIAAWSALVDAEQASLEQMPAIAGPSTRGMPKRARAIAEAARKHPEAHGQYLKAYNDAFAKQFGQRRAMPLSAAAAIAVGS